MGAILDELTLCRVGDILIINISFIEGRGRLVDILHMLVVHPCHTYWPKICMSCRWFLLYRAAKAGWLSKARK